MLLVTSFALLLGINALQRWGAGGSAAARGPHERCFARRSQRRRRMRPRAATEDAAWVRVLLIGAALLFLGLFLVLPLVTVFVEAFSKGLAVYWDAIREPVALAAIRLTLLVAAISVPANAVFGVAAAWAIAKFDFRGKSLLITAIDLPVRRVAGRLGPDLRAAVRRAGPARAVAPGARRQDHLRGARASCSRRRSSPSRSWRAS